MTAADFTFPLFILLLIFAFMPERSALSSPKDFESVMANDVKERSSRAAENEDEKADNDCVTPLTQREKRDISLCPSQDDISPCICDDNYNILSCFDLEDEHQLQRIFNAYFPQPRLTKLQLRHSSVSSLKPGVFAKLRIREFEVQENRLQVVEHGAFAGSENTALYINLNKNEIEVFDFRAVSSVQGLRQLQVAHNRLTEIPDDAFGNLTKLDFLALNDNRIRYIGKRAFGNLPSLSFLDLSNNSISVLMGFSFHLSPQLIGHLNIILNSNNISHVDKSSFADSTPAFMAIMQNNLETLNREPFEKLLTNMANKSTTAGLAVKGNPLQCDCRIKWLLENRKLLNIVRYFRCKDGRMLNNITIPELDC